MSAGVRAGPNPGLREYSLGQCLGVPLEEGDPASHGTRARRLPKVGLLADEVDVFVDGRKDIFGIALFFVVLERVDRRRRPALSSLPIVGLSVRPDVVVGIVVRLRRFRCRHGRQYQRLDGLHASCEREHLGALRELVGYARFDRERPELWQPEILEKSVRCGDDALGEFGELQILDYLNRESRTVRRSWMLRGLFLLVPLPRRRPILPAAASASSRSVRSVVLVFVVVLLIVARLGCLAKERGCGRGPVGQGHAGRARARRTLRDDGRSVVTEARRLVCGTVSDDAFVRSAGFRFRGVFGVR